MIEYLVIALAAFLTVMLFHRFGLVASCSQVFAIAAATNSIDKDPKLSSREKEHLTQQAAKQLLKLFGRILILSVAAFGLPLFPMYLLILFDWINFNQVIAILSSVEFFIVVLLVFIALYFMAKRV